MTNRRLFKPSARLIACATAILAAFAAGVLARGCLVSSPGTAEPSGAVGAVPEASVWTCSMHPQIRLPKFGLCPICNMDLIPAASADDSGGPRELKLSAHARKRAEIEVAPVERKFVSTEIRLVGRIQADETRLVSATARVGGRIDRLYVDYTGAPVGKDEPLAQIYSPELLAAQEEFLQALRPVEAMPPRTGADPAAATRRDAVRDKLRLWGLTPRQIAEIEQRGSVADHIDILAPISGVVTTRHVLKGDYVEPGMPLFTLADLSEVWLILDAYEMDLGLIRAGQDVEFEARAYPGEFFKGTISFIDPVVTESTRTVRVRVNMANPDGRLKPEMFGHGIVRSTPGAGTAPLVIPASAPLITGRRAVVYVENPADPDRFAFRPVTLGSRSGDYYIVRQGLKEGERVATRGAFKIDSSMQLLAKPSMMSAEEHTVEQTEFEILDVPAAVRASLDTLYAAYFAIQAALSRDQHTEAQAAALQLLAALAAVPMQAFTDNAHGAWMKEEPVLRSAAERIVASADIGRARIAFEPLSSALASVVRQFGSGTDQPIMRFHCPMAFDNRGADWLQNRSGVENPYFGAAMFRCGEERDVIHAGGTRQEAK